MAAKVRTWSLAAWSSGQRFRMALSLGCSSSVRVPGRRQSQFVTSRTVGDLLDDHPGQVRQQNAQLNSARA